MRSQNGHTYKYKLHVLDISRTVKKMPCQALGHRDLGFQWKNTNIINECWEASVNFVDGNSLRQVIDCVMFSS